MFIKYFVDDHGAFSHAEGLKRTWVKVWVGETCVGFISSTTRSHHVIIANCSLDHKNRETLRVNRTTSRMGNGWGCRHFTKPLLLDVFLIQTTHHSDSSPNGMWLAPADSDTMKTECSNAGLQAGRAAPSRPFIYLRLCLGPATLRMVVGKLWCSCSPASPGLLKAVLGTGTNVMLQLI